MLTRKTLATGVAATTIMSGFGAVAPAWATSNIQVLGVQETVKDINGPLTGYTVTGLMPSSDPVPYPVAGRLYEATVSYPDGNPSVNVAQFARDAISPFVNVG